MSTVVTLGPVGFKPTGAYDNTREYKKLDVVIYQGSSYIAKSDSIGQLPTNTTYWELLVQKGDTGNGITSIAKTGTSGLVDTYTITYTDETTSTFTVTNGEKGDPGEVTEEQLDEAMARANMVYNALPKVSDEGDSLTINGTANCPMKMELKGNTEQNGTPTPDYPQDVRVVTGNNSVNVIGKNLFDTTKYSSTANVTILDKNNGVLDLEGVGGYYEGVSQAFNVIPNQSYVLSYNAQIIDTSVASACYVRIREKDDTTVIATNYNSGNQTISFTPTTDEINVFFRVNGETNRGHSKYSNIQLEKGNQVTSYTSYTSQTYPINLGTMELCKIGDYQDYIYKDNGKWYKHSEIGKIVLDGSEEWFFSGSSATPTNRSVIQLFNRINPLNNNYLSNYFIKESTTSNRIVIGTTIFVSLDDTITGVVSGDTNEQKTAKLKSWLVSNNTIVYYVLATSTNTEITDTTLISQLNAIENAMSYDTQTNIVQENYSEPFIINAECVRSLKDIFELIQ